MSTGVAGKALTLANKLFGGVATTTAERSALQSSLTAAGVVLPDPTARRSIRERFKAGIIRGQSSYVHPEFLHVIGDVPQRVNSTQYLMGALYAVGTWVFKVSGFSTSRTDYGNSGTIVPTMRGIAVADGELVVSFIGYLVPIAYQTGLAVAVDQTIYHGGREYITLNAGTLAATGSGPTHRSGAVTDGDVSLLYVGPQRLPLVTLNAASAFSATPAVAWNSPKVTVLGATMIQNAANQRGGLATRSFDGQAYTEANSEGAGSIYTRTDAPNFEHTFTNAGGMDVWQDGVFVCHVWRTAAAQRFLNFNYSGLALSQKVRTFRFVMPFTMKFAGFHAPAFTPFYPYSPADPLKVVAITDSFGASTSGIPMCHRYAMRLMLGCGGEDWRVSPLGGSGLEERTVSGGLTSANFRERFTQDVINQRPDVVIIQCTGNDANGILANPQRYTADTVANTLLGLINRVKVELPNAIIIVMGLWNNRGALGQPHATLNSNAAAIAAAAGVPFIEWSDQLTDGGYLGHSDGSPRNSGVYTGDGTHRPYWGDVFTAKLLLPQVSDAANTLLKLPSLAA